LQKTEIIPGPSGRTLIGPARDRYRDGSRTHVPNSFCQVGNRLIVSTAVTKTKITEKVITKG